MSEIITTPKLFKADVNFEGPLKIDNTQVVATAAEINAAADVSAQAALVTPSSVITASADAVQTSVVKTGDIIKTTIAIDLTGLGSSGTLNDIIGAAGVCYLAAVTTAVNGVIYKAQVSCGEVPLTGDDDIDIAAATAATGAYDADVTALAGYAALMTSAGAHAIGTVKQFTALPASGTYLYLAGGDVTGGVYTAGRLFIELWGTVA